MRKGTYKYLLVALLITAVCGTLTANRAYAAENKVVRFFKNLVNWPLAVTKRSSEAVGKTAGSAIRWTRDTGTSAVETVTGKPEKIKDVVVEPITGSAETAYTAVKEGVEAPIKGTEDAFKSEEAK